MKRIVFFMFFLALCPSSVRAGEACYSSSEAEAEQGIRIHSELMIIGLNCAHMTPADQENLYAQYRKFTDDNVTLFAGYEDVLMNYFRRVGESAPEGALNDMRTFFANKIANDVAQMRPDRFCRRYAGRIAQAAAMDRKSLRQWAATIYPEHPPSHPLCP